MEVVRKKEEKSGKNFIELVQNQVGRIFMRNTQIHKLKKKDLFLKKHQLQREKITNYLTKKKQQRIISI